MGASYGGYAALMGAVRRPDLYKAAIAICGDSDLPELLANEKRGDNSEENEGYRFWSTRIGDPAADREALERASPRRRAAEINCPVMLVHGVDDPIVPVFQSRRMKAWKLVLVRLSLSSTRQRWSQLNTKQGRYSSAGAGTTDLARPSAVPRGR